MLLAPSLTTFVNFNNLTRVFNVKFGTSRYGGVSTCLTPDHLFHFLMLFVDFKIPLRNSA
jgi:hypothetical protein